MIKNFNINLRNIFGIMLLSFFLLSPGLIFSADTEQEKAPEAAIAPENSEEKKMASLEELLYTPFVYQRENRPDPFMSFISEQIAPTTVSIKGAQEEQTDVLSGMQLFEPGQLNLVAILFKGNEGMALVQDSTGKGHIIKKGQKIGRRGEIKEILPNIVLIEEWSLSTAGKKRFKTTNMVLRKEGEK